MARFALVLMSSLVTLGLAASAQTIQVNRDNKTIYVTSEGEAKAEPESLFSRWVTTHGAKQRTPSTMRPQQSRTRWSPRYFGRV